MCSIPSFCHLFSYFCSAAIYIGYITENQHNYSALSSLLLNALLLPLYTDPPASTRSSQSWKNPRYFPTTKARGRTEPSVGSWRALNSGWRQVILQSTKWDFLYNRFGRTLLAGSTVTRTTSPSCSDSCKKRKMTG